MSYRERASYMYAPEIHAASFALVELPWLGLITAATLPPLYFMLGLRSGAEYFFFFALSTWAFLFVMVSFGQMLTALVAAADSATAIVSSMLPILFCACDVKSSHEISLRSILTRLPPGVFVSSVWRPHLVVRPGARVVAVGVPPRPAVVRRVAEPLRNKRPEFL